MQTVQRFACNPGGLRATNVQTTGYCHIAPGYPGLGVHRSLLGGGVYLPVGIYCMLRKTAPHGLPLLVNSSLKGFSTATSSGCRLPLAGSAAILCTGGPDVIRKEAWSFYRTVSGVRLCWVGSSKNLEDLTDLMHSLRARLPILLSPAPHSCTQLPTCQ